MQVPGWHERTREILDRDDVQVLGIIQEQHPDRCRLFMQWKQMDWPVMVDSLNLLGVKVVHIPMLIDEYGVVRSTRARIEDLDEFLDTAYEPPVAKRHRREPPDWDNLRKVAADGDRRAILDYADALFLWKGDEGLDEAITQYGRAVALDAADGEAQFRLGVAHRRRFESAERRRDGDFAKAVEHWRKALETDPNQYIWRRRIQQYGPRLDKPYSFYDWVHQARTEIEARGETPLTLDVEPTGAELAYPAREFTSAEATAAEPDPAGRIDRDERFIRVESVVVPHTTPRPDAVRVHVLFRPDRGVRAHWNNEAEDMIVWLDPPEGWEVDARAITLPNAPRPASEEVRRIEFEVRRTDPAAPASITISGYALYNVCEDVDGVCLYRRKDLQIPVTAGAAEGP